MLQSLFLRAIFVVSLFGYSCAYGLENLAKSCIWLKNDTVASAIRGKKSVVVEDCLFFKLLDNEINRTGLKNSLTVVRPEPSPSGNDKVTVYVHASKLKDFRGPTNFRTNSEVSGVVYVSWLDNRLKWDRNDWKMQYLSIKGVADIWLPETNHGYSMASYFDEKAAETNLLNVTVSSMGNVTAEMDFNANTNCEANEFDYPMETLHCCSTLSSPNLNEIREYQIDDYSDTQQGSMDSSVKQMSWNVKSFYVSTEDAALKVCLSAERSRALLKTELFLPMAASAVFLLASPFFGSMKVQSYVKMFAILLQVLCFQFVIERQAMTWFTQVPRIFRFYEVTFATTLTSLILTLFVSGLTKIRQTLPPPHLAQKFTDKVNLFLFFCQSDKPDGRPSAKGKTTPSAEANDANAGGDGQEKRAAAAAAAASSNGSASMHNGSTTTITVLTETERKFNNEWNGFFVALNNFVSFVVLVLYFIILLVTCA